MSKGINDVFALFIIFWGFDYILKHVILVLNWDFEIIKQALAKKLMNLLDEYGLRTKIIIYIKDEGSNLNIMTNVLKSMSNVKL
jgi:hypothetical protein